MLFLNDNFIEKVDFNHFKDLRNLRIINLQNNRVLFRDVNEFTSNMLFVRDKLKQLKSFSFLSNPYYSGGPKERISEFLDFFQRKFLSNINFESEKDKLEKEFKSKIEEIMDFQQRQSESLSPKVYQIKKQIEAFSLNPNSIETKLEKFKESTNNFLQIMNSTANQSRLISAKSDVDSEAEEIEALFYDIIRDLNILTDKVDNKAFIEQCMHFLVGILRIRHGFMAESIMELLTHIAEHKKMEDVLIKNLIKNLTGKEYLDYNLNIARGDDEKILLIEEINGQSAQGTQSKRDKGVSDDEEISLASILKTYPKILESFKMIVNEKYDRLFVYLFRILLKNIKYGKLMNSLPSAFEVLGIGGFSDKQGKSPSGAAGANTNDANSFVFYAMEFFLRCFSGKAKRKILQSLHRYEIMKLIAIAIGIFRKYEFYLRESRNLGGTAEGGTNDKKIQSWFLEIVATFAKIFKSIFKYFFMPYLNKKVFSNSNEFERTKFLKYMKASNPYSKKDIDAIQIDNDHNSNGINGKIAEISEYQKHKFLCEYLQNNFRTVILDVINKDLNGKNKFKDFKFENLTEDNFNFQFENFLTSDILENYKRNIQHYRKEDNPKSNFNDLFILSNRITSYALKINVLIKTAFMDTSSKSYLKSLNELYLTLYGEFIKRLDDGEYGLNIRLGATRLEKSRSEINLRNTMLKSPEINVSMFTLLILL
jgi:archaellum component FlaC